jgi:hypothetical protein
MDAFSIPIGFSRRKQNEYKTSLGGVLTLLIFVFMLVYLIILFIDPWSTSTKGAASSSEEETDTENNSTGDGQTRLLMAKSDLGHRYLANQTWDYEVGVEQTVVPRDPENLDQIDFPFLHGFQFAAMIPTGYDPSMFFAGWITYDNEGNQIVLESEYCNPLAFPNTTDVQTHLQYIGVDYHICPQQFYSISYIFQFVMTFCQILYTSCPGEANAGSYYGAPISFAFTDGYYDHDDPANPIKYMLRTGHQIIYDPESIDNVQFTLTRNEVIDLDGRTMLFYSTKFNSGYYVYGTQGFIIQAYFISDDKIIRWNQYYRYSAPTPARRVLESVTVSDKEIIATTGDDVNDSFIFNCFFYWSQLGGLYAFFVMIFGFFMYPITRKIFLHEAVNDLSKANRQNLARANLNMYGNGMGPENEDFGEGEIFEDELNRGRSSVSGSNMKSTKRPYISKIKGDYNSSDLTGFIFSCFGGGSERVKDLKREVEILNEGRDVANLLSTLNILDHKITSLEDTLTRRQMEKLDKVNNLMAEEQPQNNNSSGVQNIQPMKGKDKSQSETQNNGNTSTSNQSHKGGPVIPNQPEEAKAVQNQPQAQRRPEMGSISQLLEGVDISQVQDDRDPTKFDVNKVVANKNLTEQQKRAIIKDQMQAQYNQNELESFNIE